MASALGILWNMNSTTQTAPRTYRDLIATRSTDELYADYAATETAETAGVDRAGLLMVRDWIMDEMEVRDSQRFAEWLDS